MPTPVCRLLPYTVADGPHNMAADEVLLESAAADVASLRFYGWSEATVSLGYFQPANLRTADPRLAALPYVRRASGGATLVHHHELTYALGLPRGTPWQTGASWLCRMHTIVAAALADLGVTARLHGPSGEEHFPGFLCFQHFTADDLLIGAAKVAGSAQRKQRGALLQHGGILLAASPSTPVLPGIRELSGHTLIATEMCAAIVRQFRQQTGWELLDGDWSEGEHQRKNELVAAKYTTENWNRKR